MPSFSNWVRPSLKTILTSLMPARLAISNDKKKKRESANYSLWLIVLYQAINFNQKANVVGCKQWRIKQMLIDKLEEKILFEKAMNISSIFPFKQMFCLICIYCTYSLIFDLSFEGIHGRECQYLPTCCASICLSSTWIHTNYISFVWLWMTEA